LTTPRFLPTLILATALLATPGAQAQPVPPTIGFLRSSPSQPFEHLVTAFREGLKEAGLLARADEVVQ
jgi:ABC-type sugar transport system substrate-binding protein